ncbi:hypothetical protein [Paenibacillus thiaminolyticus]|nr:hypothetical protein [Paenibacillus thiaminolyticus]
MGDNRAGLQLVLSLLDPQPDTCLLDIKLQDIAVGVCQLRGWEQGDLPVG